MTTTLMARGLLKLGAHYKEGGNEASAPMVPLTGLVLDSVLADSCESSIRSQRKRK